MAASVLHLGAVSEARFRICRIAQYVQWRGHTRTHRRTAVGQWRNASRRACAAVLLCEDPLVLQRDAQPLALPGSSIWTARAFSDVFAGSRESVLSAALAMIPI